ncbi:MAG: type II toxin-antitoxin system VapC family toxin [Chloroflexi bacterium]|nr:type II toxin-antitoxin system VapC family toxin [Chloroflexota bacterium]
MRFWDTSGFVPLCAQEAGTPAVHALYQEDPDIVVWWGARIECISALKRLVRMGQLDAVGEAALHSCFDDLWKTAAQVAPAEQVRIRAEQLLAAHPLRAADALQLGAALVWARDQPASHAFVCLDERLRDAARQEGFTVLP